MKNLRIHLVGSVNPHTISSEELKKGLSTGEPYSVFHHLILERFTLADCTTKKPSFCLEDSFVARLKFHLVAWSLKSVGFI